MAIHPKVCTISKVRLSRGGPGHQGRGQCAGPRIRRSARIGGASKRSAGSRNRERDPDVIWGSIRRRRGRMGEARWRCEVKGKELAFSSHCFSGPPPTQRMTSLNLELLAYLSWIQVYTATPQCALISALPPSHLKCTLKLCFSWKWHFSGFAVFSISILLRLSHYMLPLPFYDN